MERIKHALARLAPLAERVREKVIVFVLDEVRKNPGRTLRDLGLFVGLLLAIVGLTGS